MNALHQTHKQYDLFSVVILFHFHFFLLLQKSSIGNFTFQNCLSWFLNNWYDFSSNTMTKNCERSFPKNKINIDYGWNVNWYDTLYNFTNCVAKLKWKTGMFNFCSSYIFMEYLILTSFINWMLYPYKGSTSIFSECGDPKNGSRKLISVIIVFKWRVTADKSMAWWNKSTVNVDSWKC